MHPNEDVDNKVLADVIWSAMIDEGDVMMTMIIDRERKESEFIWMEN